MDVPGDLFERLVIRAAHRSVTGGQSTVSTHGEPDLVAAFQLLGWTEAQPLTVETQEAVAVGGHALGASLEG